MADYVSQAMLAFTPGPPLALVVNATGTLHMPDDEGYNTPVAVQLLDGTVMLTVSSNESGFIPPLRLPAPVMVWKSGPYLVPVVTVQGLVEAAQAAAAAAESAAEHAAEALQQVAAATTEQIDAYLGGNASGLALTVAFKADLVDGKVPTSQLPESAVVADATGTTKGAVKLAGALGGTADNPTVPGLSSKANDNAVVKLAGSQTVGGVKTFQEAPVVPDGAFGLAKLNRSGAEAGQAPVWTGSQWAPGTVAGSSSPGEGSVTDATVASGAGVSLAKTADSAAGGGRLAMTSAERTKLSQLPPAVVVDPVTIAGLPNGTLIARTS